MSIAVLSNILMTLYLQPFARWQLSWCSHNMPPPRDLDFWPFDLEVGVGVACDLGYPCAKFRLPRPFGFRVRADVRDIRRTDRQTDGRRTPITALCPLGGGIIILTALKRVNVFECRLDNTTSLSVDGHGPVDGTASPFSDDASTTNTGNTRLILIVGQWVYSCKNHRCENKKNITNMFYIRYSKNMKKTFFKHFPYSTRLHIVDYRYYR